MTRWLAAGLTEGTPLATLVEAAGSSSPSHRGRIFIPALGWPGACAGRAVHSSWGAVLLTHTTKSNGNCSGVSELPCLPYLATSLAGQIKLLYFHTAQLRVCVFAYIIQRLA